MVESWAERKAANLVVWSVVQKVHTLACCLTGELAVCLAVLSGWSSDLQEAVEKVGSWVARTDKCSAIL